MACEKKNPFLKTVQIVLSETSTTLYIATLVDIDQLPGLVVGVDNSQHWSGQRQKFISTLK